MKKLILSSLISGLLALSFSGCAGGLASIGEPKEIKPTDKVGNVFVWHSEAENILKKYNITKDELCSKFGKDEEFKQSLYPDRSYVSNRGKCKTGAQKYLTYSHIFIMVKAQKDAIQFEKEMPQRLAKAKERRKTQKALAQKEMKFFNDFSNFINKDSLYMGKMSGYNDATYATSETTNALLFNGKKGMKELQMKLVKNGFDTMKKLKTLDIKIRKIVKADIKAQKIAKSKRLAKNKRIAIAEAKAEALRLKKAVLKPRNQYKCSNDYNEYYILKFNGYTANFGGIDYEKKFGGWESSGGFFHIAIDENRGLVGKDNDIYKCKLRKR